MYNYFVTWYLDALRNALSKGCSQLESDKIDDIGEYEQYYDYNRHKGYARLWTREREGEEVGEGQELEIEH